MCKMKFLNNKTNSNIQEYKNWLEKKGIIDTLDHFYDWINLINYNSLLKSI